MAVRGRDKGRLSSINLFAAHRPQCVPGCAAEWEFSWPKPEIVTVLSPGVCLRELTVQKRPNSLANAFLASLWAAKKNPQTIQLLDKPQHLAPESISDQMSWLTDFRGSANYELTAVLWKLEKSFSRWVGLKKKNNSLSTVVLYSLLYI